MTDKVSLHQYGHSFQHKLIASLLKDRQLLEQIQDILEPNYFESQANKWVVEHIKKYFTKYKKPPTLEALKIIIDGDKSDCIPGIKGWGKKTLMKKLPMILEDRVLSVQDLIDEGLDEDIIRLNYDLMQLDDVDISGNAKLKIQKLSDDADNRLVKFEFQKMVLEDKLHTAFPNLDVWLAEAFSRLNIIMENHINDR